MANAMRTTGNPPIKVAVVGHTNAGKTSLIRTLLRDDRFGKIDDAAGTTRYVEKSAIFSGDDEVLNLFDTPGFEDSSALLQALEDLSETLQARLPADVLRAFIAQADDFPDFVQETKVLRQSINSDVLLYVIDVREPFLGKYRDEVEILSKAGKPILPVFNFIAGNRAALKRWREQMAQFNLHAALE
ncbi:MAG: GTPase domain-containing protein, partial [Gammaproteobacteria bacterium]